MAARWSGWGSRFAPLWRTRPRCLRSIWCTILLMLVVAVVLVGDSGGTSKQQHRQDLVPVRDLARSECPTAARDPGDLPNLGLAPERMAASQTTATRPFAGVICGYCTDFGQQVLSRHAEIMSGRDTLSRMRFCWTGWWEQGWCWGTFPQYNLWDPLSGAFLGGYGCAAEDISALPTHTAMAFADTTHVVVNYALTQLKNMGVSPCTTLQDLYLPCVSHFVPWAACGVSSIDTLRSTPPVHSLWPKLAGPVDFVAPPQSVYSQSACRAYHLVSREMERGYLEYYRFDPCVGTWSGPVVIDSEPNPSHFLVSSPSVGRIILAFCRPRDYASGNTVDNDLVYYESTDDGLSWIGGSFGTLHNVSVYVPGDKERAYGDAAGAFTSDGRLHLVWVSAVYDSKTGTASDSRCLLRHWTESQPGLNGPMGLSQSDVLRLANWVPAGKPGVFNRDICNLSVGVGDGSMVCAASPGGTNRDYLYVLYTQFGSEDPLDLADSSLNGYQNGNLYMKVSPDGGRSWTRGLCMSATDSIGGTPTRSPNCFSWDGVTSDCESEHLGTITPRVGATVDIAYTEDLVPGNCEYEDAIFTYDNKVRYLHLPGAVAAKFCPASLCWCGMPGDLTQDSTIDVLDVLLSIGITFVNHPPVSIPPSCPGGNLSDVNADGVVDVLDVMALINYVFQNGAIPPSPCASR